MKIFISIGVVDDESRFKKMNEKGIDSSKNESVKEEGKEEEGTMKRKGGHIKMIARKKKRSQSNVDSDDEHKKCLKIMEIILLSTEPMGISGHSTISWKEVTLDGFVLILWGDLKIMMESSTEGNELSDFWSGQQDWKIVTWRMLDLGMEVERESSVAFDLIRFIKQQIDEE
ncbi:hypothetical protein Tco_1006726 [Tanacetum coccineum]|uniref:Uncharacterized protein n=1 Tax=Tanacetum coccineum TaxID=301880 RepID=A0ABQ5FIQ2_9ASTR